jgi:hypothetical protein
MQQTLAGVDWSYKKFCLTGMKNGRMTLCAHGSIQNGTRQDVKRPLIKANNKIAMKMPSCYMQQNVPSPQRHQ